MTRDGHEKAVGTTTLTFHHFPVHDVDRRGSGPGRGRAVGHQQPADHVVRRPCRPVDAAVHQPGNSSCASDHDEAGRRVQPLPRVRVSVTVVVERSVYAPGQTVKGSTTIRNGSSSTCLLAPREVMHIEDQTGTIVGNFAYTMEFREPVVAAPGRTLTAAFQWDQKHGAGISCVQVPAGAYVAVARWLLQVPSSNQTASYGPSQASFRIGG